MRSGINGWDYACSKMKNIFEWALNLSLIDDKNANPNEKTQAKAPTTLTWVLPH